jgi:hypothetical protein
MGATKSYTIPLIPLQAWTDVQLRVPRAPGIPLHHSQYVGQS